MNSQPHSPFGCGFDDVYNTRGQEQVVATFQHDNFTCYLELRFAANEDDPLVLRLNRSDRSDVRRAHDSFHHEILVLEKNIKALAGSGR